MDMTTLCHSHDRMNATDSRHQPNPSPGTSGKLPFLAVRGIHKRFAGVHALRGVDLTIETGQIYHLIGENGCGKSTLIKIIAGAQPPDEGEILIEGQVHTRLSPIKALAAGIETVYQDFSLIPNLSVAENIALTQQLVQSRGHLFRRLDRKALMQTAARALTAIGLPHTPDFMRQRVDSLPIATRQMVAIARAIATDARLVIMDEPTTALTKREVDHLIGVVNRLRAHGVAVLFVTHKLGECKAIGGRVVIFRDGQKVMEGDANDYSQTELGYWMTGRRLDDTRYRPAPDDGAGETPESAGPPRLTVAGLTRAGVFSEISFSLGHGEILGITGLLDSGRNELALALAGVHPADTGQIMLDNRQIDLHRPADAIAAGIGYLPEDRLSEGLFLEKPIRENFAAVVFGRLCRRFGLLDQTRVRDLAHRLVEQLQIATPDIAHPVQTLSGGNQQRVLLGRWLAIEPRVLILHGPTVGVDVGSKDTIYRIIQSLAAQGMSILIVSDDLPELLQNCDSIRVMRKGRITHVFHAETTSETDLYDAMTAEPSEREKEKTCVR